MLAFQPRRPQSPWSQINQEHVARLIEEGKMRPGGFAEIERAKADGRWDAAYRQKDAPVPDDLRAALDANPAAAAKFETPRRAESLRDPVPHPVGQAGRDPGAQDRQYVEMLARGETIF